LKPQPLPHPDHNKYIEAIRRCEQRVLKEIYRIERPKHVSWVIKHGGTKQEGFDNFQDGMEVIVRSAFKKSFILKYPFLLFLHGVCRKLWFKKLRDKKREKDFLSEMVRNLNPKEYIDEATFENALDEAILGDCWEQLKARTFQKISTLCKQLLTMDLAGKDVDEISEELDMTSNAIYRRRSACKHSWRKAMEADSDFKACNPFNL